nr:aminoacetone oxidase family FAD-binding enzyme [Ruminococcus sp. zg-924]
MPYFYGDNVKNNSIIDIAIIGGGASGLMCGCIAGQESQGRLRITIFERNSKSGRKLLATGNGRCNLGNTLSSAESYFCDSSIFPDKLKQRLTFEYTKKLFGSLGLMIKTDSAGRAYPQSGNASSVIDILRNSLKKYNIEERVDEKVLSIKKSGGKFIISTSSGEHCAHCVILACGGSASPVFGSDGCGFALAKAFGHTVIKPYPSLTPLYVCEDLRSIKGVRCDCEIKLKKSGDVIACEYGELQINENNISGICVFNLSHYVNLAYSKGEKAPEIVIDLLPTVNINKLKSFVMKTVFANGDTALDEVLTGVMNKKLCGYIIKKAAALSPSVRCSELSKHELIEICNEIKSFKLTAKQNFDFTKAQVSGGGVNVEEIDLSNMSSKKVSKLYFAGEIVNIDAPCGGFNLQWAWASAAVSAKSAVLGCLNDKNK